LNKFNMWPIKRPPDLTCSKSGV